MKVDKSKWQYSTLGKVGTVISGATPKTNNPLNWEGGTHNWVTPAELKGEKMYGETVKKITDEALKNTKLTLMQPGTVLLTSRAPIGKVAIAAQPMYCNQGFKNISCGEKLNNVFLYYYLIANKAELNRRGNGVTFKEISKKIVEEFPIVLPPMEIQEAIGAELDALQEVIDGYSEQIADLDALAQSIFLDSFGDPIANPKGWEVKSLKELVYKMSTGPFGSMLHKEDYCDSGIPAINPQDIKYNQISIENIAKVNVDKASELSRYVLNENDVVIARRGDLSKCAVVGNEHKGWLCGTGSFFITLRDYNPILFFYCYTSKSIQKYLNDKCIGSTMPNLNQGILSSLKLPMPPLELQQQFAAQVEAIEKQKNLLRQQLADAEMLMAERMQYYFS